MLLVVLGAAGIANAAVVVPWSDNFDGESAGAYPTNWHGNNSNAGSPALVISNAASMSGANSLKIGQNPTWGLNTVATAKELFQDPTGLYQPPYSPLSRYIMSWDYKITGTTNPTAYFGSILASPFGYGTIVEMSGNTVKLDNGNWSVNKTVTLSEAEKADWIHIVVDANLLTHTFSFTVNNTTQTGSLTTTSPIYVNQFRAAMGNKGGGGGAVMYLDNFNVVVPEPATLVLLCLGGLTTLVRRRA
jgi:hypothetical protein